MKILGRPWENMPLIYTLLVFLGWIIRDVHKLCQDIEHDPIIKDQVADLGCLSVCMFGNFLAPVLVAAHMVSNVDLGDESKDEGEGS